jgi:hypothetical protein
LANTGVTATTYGTSTAVPTIAVDSKGRITSASNTNITFPVTTVNGFAGTVVLTTSDVAEGTNQYFTTARAQASITGGASSVVTANLTASRALVSDGSGKIAASATTTTTEIGYLAGVTSAIQTQLNGKLNLTGGTLTGGLIGTTGSFSSGGSGDTFTIGHTSGSGIALNITKAGNGEGLVINKTSGSGNALSVTGTTSLGALTGTSATFSSTLGVTGALNGSTASFTGNIQTQNSGGVSYSALNTAGGFAKLEVTANATSNAILSYTNQLTINGGTLSITPATTFANNIDAKGSFNGFAGATHNLLVDWSAESQITTLTATNLFFGTNATRRLTINGSTGAATFSSTISATSGYFNGIGLNATPSSVGTSADYVQFRNTGGDFYVGKEGASNGGFFTGSIAYDNIFYSDRPYNFIINGSSKVYISGGGNLLVGTTTDNGNKLQVNGTFYSSGIGSFYVNGTTSLYLQNSSISAGNSSGVTGLYLGDAGSGVNTLTREKISANTARTYIYTEQGYNSPAVGAFFYNTAGYQGNNSTAWSTVSDIRIKENIRPISDSLQKILSLKPCHFEYKTNLGKTKTGFIAQEFEQVLPGHVIESPVSEEHKEFIPEEDATIKSIDTDLIPYLVAAIQELEARIKELEAK